MTVEFKPMSNDELKSYVVNQMSLSDMNETEIGKERRDNLEYYENRSYKDVVKGNRSKVQTSDIYENVSWLHSQIMELLYSSGTPVEFIPTGSTNKEELKNNIDQAKQETATVNHVINQENEGFNIIYQWIKDALIQKNGVIKVYWDKKVKEEQETYEKLSHAEYLRIADDEDVFIKQHTLYINGEEQLDNIIPPIPPIPADLPLELQLQAAQAQQDEIAARLKAFTHDVKLLRKNTNAQIVIENVAPENFFVNRTHNSLDLSTAIFCAQVERKTRGQLINEGFDPELVMNLPIYQADYYNEDAVLRYKKEQPITGTGQSSLNKLAEYVEVIEAYFPCDYDGDGKLELCQVIMGGGRTGEILSTEEVDSIPFIGATPEINCYRFYGSCTADRVLQIQRAKTAITRQILDNLYASNNPQKVVNLSLLDDGGVDDIKNTDIDSIIRVTSQDAVNYKATPFVAAQSLPILDLMDKYATRRTGVSDVSQGLDPAMLKDQSMFIGAKMLNASQQKVLFLARTFAETAFRQLYLRIHELLTKYEKNDKIIDISGSYVEVNPRNWRKRTSVRPLIGTGNNTTEMRIVALQQVLNLQKEAIASGGLGVITDIDKVYNTLSDLIDLMGLQDVDKYFIKPQPVGAQQPENKPDPAFELGMADIQARKEIAALNAGVEKYKTDQQAEISKTKLIQEAFQKKKDQDLEQEKINLQEKKYAE